MTQRDGDTAQDTEPQPKAYRQNRFVRPAGACELLIVRHGESEPAIEGRPFPLVDGHSNPALDPVGEAQALRVADRLEREGIERIYVTTLRRTHQTAAPLAERLGIEPIVEPDLREVHLGEWENGTFRRKMAEGHPRAIQMITEERWDAIPGAEPNAAVDARVRGAITRIAADNADRAVVVVAHGGVIGHIMAMASGSRPFAFIGCDNASISHLVVSGERWSLRRFNDTAHLNLQFTVAPEPLT